MLELVRSLAETNLFLLAFSVLLFEIPRYTLSLGSLVCLACADELAPPRAMRRSA